MRSCKCLATNKYATVPFAHSPVQVPAGAETAKLKVKISLNLHGLVSVEQVQAIEELEDEVRGKEGD